MCVRTSERREKAIDSSPLFPSLSLSPHYQPRKTHTHTHSKHTHTNTSEERKEKDNKERKRESVLVRHGDAVAMQDQETTAALPHSPSLSRTHTHTHTLSLFLSFTPLSSVPTLALSPSPTVELRMVTVTQCSFQPFCLHRFLGSDLILMVPVQAKLRGRGYPGRTVRAGVAAARSFEEGERHRPPKSEGQWQAE